MSKIIVYSKQTCPYCSLAKSLLNEKEVEFEIRDIEMDSKAKSEFDAHGARTVPQIVVDGKWLGGYSDIAALDEEGKLDEILNA